MSTLFFRTPTARKRSSGEIARLKKRIRRLYLPTLLALLILLTGTVLSPAGSTAALSSAARPTNVSQHTWTIERVIAPHQFEQMGNRSLALDAAGQPHIAYGGNFLYHAWYDGTAWQVETVDNSGSVGLYTSMAIGADGHLHISYYDERNGLLKHAYQDGTSWQIETVGITGGTNNWTSLALDAAGLPRITYADGSNRALEYARYDGTTWQNETVLTIAPEGWETHNSLALDAEGHAPITQARVAGPVHLPTGVSGLYMTTLDPYTATLPLYSWNNGRTGQVETYSWSTPGTYTVSVNAANRCGRAADTMTLDVSCQPLEAAAIDGLAQLPLGIAGLYTVTYTPITASLPMTWTWGNGAGGATAWYSWTVTGTHVISVAGQNDCGQAQAASPVTVFCQEITGLAVSGPRILLVGSIGTYAASAQPITASRPLTLTWDNGFQGATAHYSWTVPGDYTVTVVMVNPCSEITGTLAVQVLAEWPYSFYLPIIPQFNSASRGPGR